MARNKSVLRLVQQSIEIDIPVKLPSLGNSTSYIVSNYQLKRSQSRLPLGRSTLSPSSSMSSLNSTCSTEEKGILTATNVFKSCCSKALWEYVRAVPCI